MVHARIGIVWNPSKTELSTLEQALEAHRAAKEHTAEVLWFETSEQDPGQKATASALATGVDTIIAAGGDGTVRAVIEELATSPQASAVTLGIIAMGTGNLLARNLGVPLDDLAAAFEHALNGETQVIDVGMISIELPEGSQQHAFAVMAGFGIDANMIVETDDDLKDKVGWLAYVESLGRALSASELVEAELSFDGGEPEAMALHTIMIGNCGTLQGGLALLPDADPTDGELDALLLSAEGISGWVSTFRNMVWDNGLRRFFARDQDGEPRSSEDTEYRRLRSLDIKLSSAQEFEVDGDHLGASDRARFTILPKAIRVNV